MDFFTCVHHEGALTDNGFVKRLSCEDQDSRIGICFHFDQATVSLELRKLDGLERVSVG